MDCGKVALPPPSVAGDFHWKVRLVQTSTFLEGDVEFCLIPWAPNSKQKEIGRKRMEKVQQLLVTSLAPTVSCSAFLGSVRQGDVRLGRGGGLGRRCVGRFGVECQMNVLEVSLIPTRYNHKVFIKSGQKTTAIKKMTWWFIGVLLQQPNCS